MTYVLVCVCVRACVRVCVCVCVCVCVLWMRWRDWLCPCEPGSVAMPNTDLAAKNRAQNRATLAWARLAEARGQLHYAVWLASRPLERAGRKIDARVRAAAVVLRPVSSIAHNVAVGVYVSCPDRR